MDRNINAPFMLPISEKYVELGVMIMGKIESGRVKKGDSLLLMPNKVSGIRCPWRELPTSLSSRFGDYGVPRFPIFDSFLNTTSETPCFTPRLPDFRAMIQPSAGC